MTERPILFSAPMVRALLAGTKTQTRRVVKQYDGAPMTGRVPATLNSDRAAMLRCPYGAPGDTLVVRETFRLSAEYDDLKPTLVQKDAPVWYEATTDRTRPEGWGKKRVSIHMPRWASRLTLRITDVRVERLNDCTEADALAEGIIEFDPTEEDPAEFAYTEGGVIFSSAQEAYRYLWDSIQGPGSWAINPWVWCLSVERVQL